MQISIPEINALTEYPGLSPSASLLEIVEFADQAMREAESHSTVEQMATAGMFTPISSDMAAGGSPMVHTAAPASTTAQVSVHDIVDALTALSLGDHADAVATYYMENDITHVAMDKIGKSLLQARAGVPGKEAMKVEQHMQRRLQQPEVAPPAAVSPNFSGLQRLPL